MGKLIFSITFIVYIVLVILITVISSRKQKGAGAFVTGNSNMGVFMSVMLVVGANVSGTGTVGVAEGGYSYGLAAVWAQFAGVIGLLVALLFGIFKFYRVMALDGALSHSEAVGRYYSRRVRILISLISACALTGMFALQPIAAASVIAPAFGLNSNLVLWCSAVLFIFIAVAGGIKSVAGTNVLHTLVMLITLGGGALLVMQRLGGMDAIVQEVPASYFSLTSIGWPTVLAYAITCIGIMVNPMSLSPCFSAKSIKTVNRSAIICMFLLVPLALLNAMLGISAKAVGFEIKASNAIYVITEMVHPLLNSFAIIGILAAIFSSAPILILSAGNMLGRDIYVGLINKDATDKQQLLMIRAACVVLGVIGTYIGVGLPSIMSGLMGAIQMTTVPAMVLFSGIVCKNIDEKIAFWGVLVSGAVSILWYAAGMPFGIQSVWPGLVSAIVVMLPLLAISKGKVNPNYDTYRERLKYYQNSGEL